MHKTLKMCMRLVSINVCKHCDTFVGNSANSGTVLCVVYTLQMS